MAKKKDIGISTKEWKSESVSDNNPSSGLLPIPDYSTDPANGYSKSNVGGTDRFSFTALIGKGESPKDGDVNVNTANGVSNSKGQGFNQQYNWGKGNSGIWNKNDDWDGGNMTGQ